MKALLVLFLLLQFPLSASAATATTYYLDGAVTQQYARAKQGYLELVVPPGAVPGSLRIVPGGGVTLTKVLVVPNKPGRKISAELAGLDERETLLQDRLKALAVREEIFKAAAKSQSAKAPRRSRTNPEPLTAIRQGTDYAITQLEAVYQARRKADREIARIQERRNRLRQAVDTAGALARIWLTPVNGSVSASWIRTDSFWSPAYQLRIVSDGNAFIDLYAGSKIAIGKGEGVELHLSALEALPSPTFGYHGEATPLYRYAIKPVSIEGGSLKQVLRVTFVNLSDTNLPAGETACFRNGTYMGTGTFPGAAAGKSAEVVCKGS